MQTSYGFGQVLVIGSWIVLRLRLLLGVPELVPRHQLSGARVVVVRDTGRSYTKVRPWTPATASTSLQQSVWELSAGAWTSMMCIIARVRLGPKRRDPDDHNIAINQNATTIATAAGDRADDDIELGRRRTPQLRFELVHALLKVLQVSATELPPRPW